MQAEGTITTLTHSLASTATVRLAGLHKMAVFYTPLEERFERISRLGKRALRVRVAAVSLFADDKQWFKSIQGWRKTEIPLADSLCRRLIETGEPLIVPDTRLDPVLADHKLVTAGPRFRFYAGYPLKDRDGTVIGTFCVFDVKPRDVDDVFRETLTDLGQLAEREIVTADLWDAQTQLVAKLGEARRQALLDTLTRVWNRRGGMELLEMMLEHSRDSGESFAVCMVDIDLFKQVNDSQGHQVGDQVLCKLAASIVGSVRPKDIVSRYGGDEFLLILRDADADVARRIAGRIRTNLEKMPLPVRQGEVSLTLSLGIAVCNPHEEITSKMLIDRADQALYHSKGSGRDGAALWPDDIC